MRMTQDRIWLSAAWLLPDHVGCVVSATPVPDGIREWFPVPVYRLEKWAGAYRADTLLFADTTFFHDRWAHENLEFAHSLCRRAAQGIPYLVYDPLHDGCPVIRTRLSGDGAGIADMAGLHSAKLRYEWRPANAWVFLCGYEL